MNLTSVTLQLSGHKDTKRVCTRLGSTESRAQNPAPTLPPEEQPKNLKLVLVTLRTAPAHVAEFKISHIRGG